MSDTEALLAAIDALPGCPDTKARVRALIASMRGRRIWIARRVFDVPERVDLARRLLASGMTRADVARAVAERAGCCLDTAYEAIRAAIDDRATMRQRAQARQLDLLAGVDRAAAAR